MPATKAGAPGTSGVGEPTPGAATGGEQTADAYRIDTSYVINRSPTARSVFYITSRNNRCVAECWSEAMAKRITRLLNADKAPSTASPEASQ